MAFQSGGKKYCGELIGVNGPEGQYGVSAERGISSWAEQLDKESDFQANPNSRGVETGTCSCASQSLTGKCVSRNLCPEMIIYGWHPLWSDMKMFMARGIHRRRWEKDD